MPVGETLAQLELEANLLTCLVETLDRISHEAGDPPLTSVLGSVLLSGRLCIDVPASVIPQFLDQLLPVVTDGRVIGIPGLRPRAERNHLDLRTIDPRGVTKAVVRLRQADRRSLPLPEASKIAPWLSHRDVLHDAELASIQVRDQRPHDLMSAILRRLLLWRSATCLTIEIEEAELLRIRWRDGPAAHAVAAILTESSAGLGAVQAIPSMTKGGAHWLVLARSNDVLRTPAEPLEAWWEVLQSFDRSPASWPQFGWITHDVWEQPEMRDALSNRNIIQVYRLLRRRDMSQRQIAALTGQSQSEVSEILKGRQVMAYDVLARIADGLSIPRGYMGLAYDDATAVRVTNPQDDEDESDKRRRFLAHAAAVTMGAARMTPFR
jgi:transcriptional regulator with XRE-family HTH domain